MLNQLKFYLLLPLLLLPASGYAETCQPFDALTARLRALVTANYLGAEFTADERSIIFRFDTRKFMVHEADMMGNWQEAFSEEGPNRKGILGEIHLEPGPYCDQAVVPQSWDKRYFTIVLHAPYSKECDSHLHARLWYPPGLRSDFIIQYFKAVDEFGLSTGTESVDQIDSVVGSLDQYGLWKNGLFYAPQLPETATPQQIIEECVKNIGFEKGHIRKFEILKVKRVTIPPDSTEYDAALIDSDQGKKVVLFSYEKPNGWWNRFYDAK